MKLIIRNGWKISVAIYAIGLMTTRNRNRNSRQI